ncbi:MAG: ABC transporter ATP-binding protein [Pseudomonadota bacterium]|nr:ABC transporter ATP-binding protein [Pseudomonadota bacterium]
MFGLQLEGLCKSYGTQTVVDEVSLTVPEGRFVCFLGPSGCGKTTLLRMIAGLEQPSCGRILLNDRDITASPVQQRNFAMVFQALALFSFLTVEENIGYSLRVRGIARRDRRTRVRELLELIKLPDVAKRRIDQLSGGQRQRVAIARALAQEPQLFLLDEPLSALDAQLRDHMQVELRQLQQTLKVTTILVTHDQREAMTLADSIVIMANGKVQQVGAPTEIYRRPANRFVAGFIGQSNLLEARVLDRQAVSLWGRAISGVPVPAGMREGDAVTFMIRPQNVRVRPVESDPGGAWRGRVSFARDVGERVELRIDCAGRELLATASPAEWEQVRGAAEVSIECPASAAVVLTC